MIIDEILKELFVIQNIGEDQKINTGSGEIIIKDQSYIDGVNRLINGESRNKNIEYIIKIFSKAIELKKHILNSSVLKNKSNDSDYKNEFKKKIAMLEDISNGLEGSITGINNLIKTYHDDVQIESKLKVLIKNIEREVEEINNDLLLLTN